MPLGLGAGLTKGGIIRSIPGIVTDGLVMKHMYPAGAVQPLNDGAAYFDGSDLIDYGSGSDLDVAALAFSVSFWFYNLADTSDALVSKGHSQGSGDGWAISVTGNEQIYFDIHDASNRDDTHTDNNVAPLNTWTHVCCTRVAGTGARTIYINGVSSNSATETDVTTITDAAINLKVGTCSNNRLLTGYISNFGYWVGTALTQPQVKSIMFKEYSNLTSTEKTNLKIWNSYSANANDESGNGNNGTTTGF